MPRAIDSDDRLTAYQRSVLMALASRANADGECWPSLATIAKDAKVSTATVKRCIPKLVEYGYISKRKRTGEHGGPVSTLYKILFKKPRDSASNSGDDGSQPLAHTEPGVRSERTKGRVTGSQGLALTEPLSIDIEVETRSTTKEVPPISPEGGQSASAYTSEFEKFWETYPRRVGKRAAFKAFEKAVERASLETILEGATKYRDDPNRIDQYTAHPSTWLNQDRWDDDPLPARHVPDPWGDRIRATLAMGNNPQYGYQPPQIVNGYQPRVIEGGDYDYL